MDTPDSGRCAVDPRELLDDPDDMDSSEPDRNPSPPPEFAEHPELLMAESIGNTAFSKHWLFTTLIKLIEEVDRENEVDSNLAVDVDEELQTELCKLWDMSMNSDVVKFLEEFQAVEIMSGIIEKSKAPRVIEICVGILGNMACEQSVCQNMSENHKFIDLVLDMMDSRDGPFLVENTRLIATSLSNTGARGPWIRAIQRSEEILDHLMFIFSSSTNCDLLKNTAELVDTLLDLEPDLCVSWATIDFIQSLLEATEQIGSNHSEAMEVYLHIFQSFSTTEPGVEALVSHVDKLEKKIIKYLNIVCEYEIVGLEGKNGPLSSALSVLNILLTSRPLEKLSHLWKDETIIRILLKILEPLYPMLMKYREDVNTNQNKPADVPQSDHVSSSNQSEAANGDNIANEAKDNEIGPKKENAEKLSLDEEEREELCQLEVLYEVLSGYLLDYCCIAFRDVTDTRSEKESKSGAGVSETNRTLTDDVSVSDETDNTKTSDQTKTGLVANTKLDELSAVGETDSVKLSKSADKKSDDSEACDEIAHQSSGNEAVSSTVQDRLTDAIKNAGTNFDDVNKTDDESSPQSGCVPVLTYLDEGCSRWRINNLGLTLKESDTGKGLFTQLLTLAQKHDKERLVRILTDIDEGRIITRADSSRDAFQEDVEPSTL